MCFKGGTGLINTKFHDGDHLWNLRVREEHNGDLKVMHNIFLRYCINEY